MPGEPIPPMSLCSSFYSSEQFFLLIFWEFLLTVLHVEYIFIGAQCSDVCCSKRDFNYFIVYWIILLSFWSILMQTSAKVQLFPLIVTLKVWCKVMSQIKSPSRIKQDPNRMCSHSVCEWNSANTRHVDNYDEKPLSIYVGKWNCWCVFSIIVWDIMGDCVLHSHCILRSLRFSL